MATLLTTVEDAAAVVDRGGIVVVPTETVYGLAAKPERDLVARIFELKRRPPDKAIQLLIPGAEWLERCAKASGVTKALAEAFWPGPLTLVVSASDGAPPAVVVDGNVGLRVPSHSVALDLLARSGPLVASSANRSGDPTPADLEAIAQMFEEEVDAYLDGGHIAGTGSTVVDLSSSEPVIRRVGPISRTDLESVAGVRFAGG